jgi:hypothetical protein
MTRFKIGLLIALAIVIAALAGWVYGWWGTRPMRAELEACRLRLQLVEARMQILDARVDVYTANFGNASRHLEYAKPSLQAARADLERAGKAELVTRLETALKHASDAQQLASKFSQDANSRAGDATRLIDEVLQATRQ